MPSLRARLTNAFLRMTTKSMWRPDLDILTVRRHAARMDARLARKRATGGRRRREVAGVPATWIGEPSLSERGTILYLHGGAWCIHLPAVYRKFATTLSALTGMRVLLPDYRLAPEHPFPAATDDCLAAYRWLVEQRLRRAAAGGRGRFGGREPDAGHADAGARRDAADAGLRGAAVAVHRPHELRAPPRTTTSTPTRCFREAAFELLPPIVCPGEDRPNPLLSPLFGSWVGLPPLLFHAGSTEVLLDDSVRAQDRASQAGVHAGIEVWRDMPHVFQVFNWLPESKVAMRQVADFIAAHAVPRRPRRATTDTALRPQVIESVEPAGAVGA